MTYLQEKEKRVLDLQKYYGIYFLSVGRLGVNM